jgi:hypothetical protein
MSAVPAPAAGGSGFCIDSYEVVVEGPTGDHDQLRADAVRPQATAASRPGGIPTIGLTFVQAVLICENTPVLDAEGAEVGRKHLATGQEWEDAGDGLPGPGGTVYPWGDTWDDARCATVAADGHQVFDGVQPTGSFPGCVSPFGVYDQIGNAWEWVDAGWRLDVAAWFAAAVEEGHRLTVDAEGLLVAPGLDLGAFLVEGNGVHGALSVADDGHLVLTLAEGSGTLGDVERTGYLGIATRMEPPTPDAYLPVGFVPMPGAPAPGAAHLRLRRDRDGAPMPDKRGCAFYVGQRCTLQKQAFHHDATATLSVGFRCASPRLPSR